MIPRVAAVGVSLAQRGQGLDCVVFAGAGRRGGGRRGVPGGVGRRGGVVVGVLEAAPQVRPLRQGVRPALGAQGPPAATHRRASLRVPLLPEALRRQVQPARPPAHARAPRLVVALPQVLQGLLAAALHGAARPRRLQQAPPQATQPRQPLVPHQRAAAPAGPPVARDQDDVIKDATGNAHRPASVCA